MLNDDLPVEVTADPAFCVFAHQRTGHLTNSLSEVKKYANGIKGLEIYACPDELGFHFDPSFSQFLDEFTELEYLKIEWPMLDWRSDKMAENENALPNALMRLISLPTLGALDIISARNFMVDALSGFHGSRLHILEVSLEHRAPFAHPNEQVNSTLQANPTPQPSNMFPLARLMHLTIQGSRNVEIITGFPNWLSLFPYAALQGIESLVLVTTFEDALSGYNTSCTQDLLIALGNQHPSYSLKNLRIIHQYPSDEPQHYSLYPYTFLSQFTAIKNLEVNIEILETDGRLLNMQHINNILFDWFYDLTPSQHSFQSISNFRLICNITFSPGLNDEANFRYNLRAQVTSLWNRLNKHLDGIWDKDFFATRTVDVKLVLYRSKTHRDTWRNFSHGVLLPNQQRWNTQCDFGHGLPEDNKCLIDGERPFGMPVFLRGCYFHVLSVDG